MTEPFIVTERRGAVALIRLNRADKMNALNPEMGGAFTAAIEEANGDGRIGAIVVTGTGKAFCAGADIGATFARNLPGDDKPKERPALLGARDWVALMRKSKPLIAAVNGVSIGVGVTMILPMDIILASPEARFRFAFVKMGIVPELASSHFLVSRVGFGRASEMMLTARFYGGEEAHALGLVDRLYPAGSLVEEALALGATIAENPDPQLRMTKCLLTANGSETDLVLAQRRELEALDAAYKSPEHHEAVKAFLEKRPAVFR